MADLAVLAAAVGLTGSPLVAAAFALLVVFAANSRRANAAAVHIRGAAPGVSAGASPDAEGAIPSQARAPVAAAFAGRGADIVGVDFAVVTVAEGAGIVPVGLTVAAIRICGDGTWTGADGVFRGAGAVPRARLTSGAGRTDACPLTVVLGVTALPAPGAEVITPDGPRAGMVPEGLGAGLLPGDSGRLCGLGLVSAARARDRDSAGTDGRASAKFGTGFCFGGAVGVDALEGVRDPLAPDREPGDGDEPLDDDSVDVEPPDPLVSANAAAGMATIAVPMPRATASAPTRPT